MKKLQIAAITTLCLLTLPAIALGIYAGVHLLVSFIGWELYAINWVALRAMVGIAFIAGLAATIHILDEIREI